MRELENINKYWTTQAEFFSKISLNELTSFKFELWYSILAPEVVGGKALSILDAGCGAGFFEMFLGRWGHHVTAVDYNEKMLEEARRNVEILGLSNQTTFIKMDAQNLAFEDESFDMVISRNITWVLENPEKAYREWIRVLKPGGTLLNFDANWFLHLSDEEAGQAYQNGIAAAEAKGFSFRESDHNHELQELIQSLPLTKLRRPQWDVQTLLSMKCESIAVRPRLPNEIYDDYYQEIYREIPTFLISAVKGMK